MGNAELLPDLLLEILAWLPLLEILRIRSVCKAWRDVIRDPRFLALFRSRNTESTTMLVGGEDEAYLLHENSKSWVISPDFPRPADPSAILITAAAGLVCYVVHNDTTCEHNFVVCNPITKEWLQLPTLHTEWYRPIPQVVMVVRHGRLHQLWVDFEYAVTCVYDCFISKASMERRIANSGKLILPLPNLWMEFFYDREPLKCLTYLDSNIILAHDKEDIVVDVDDFSVAVCAHSPSSQELADNWIANRFIMFESMGKLLAYWSSPWSDLIRVCLVTILLADRISRHEPLFDIDITHVIPDFGFCIVGCFHDKCLISCRNRNYPVGDFLFHNVFGCPGQLMRAEDATRIHNSVLYEWIVPYRLELSLIDSPGSSLVSEDDFNWDMVSFPQENQEFKSLDLPRWDPVAKKVVSSPD